jgi:predicted GIY-YIG superfamily endonuclease
MVPNNYASCMTGCPTCFHGPIRDHARWKERQDSARLQAGMPISEILTSWTRVIDPVLLRCTEHDCEYDGSPHSYSQHVGCPQCRATGFDPRLPAFFYLLELLGEGTIKFGVTNNLKKRIATHRRMLGRLLVVEQAPFEVGRLALEAERRLKRSLKHQGFVPLHGSKEIFRVSRDDMHPLFRRASQLPTST